MEQKPELVKSINLPDLSTGKKIVIALGGIAGLGLLTPLIFNAVMAGLGIYVLGVLAAGTFVFYKFSGLFMQKLGNKVLAEEKAEARKNPVEQLERGLMDMIEAAGKDKETITAEHAKISTFIGGVNAMKKKKPSLDYTDKDKKIHLAFEALKRRIEEYNQKIKGIESFRAKIDDLKDELELSKLDIAIDDSNAHSPEDERRRIMMNESFQALQVQINKGYSGMELNVSGLLENLSSGDTKVDFDGVGTPSSGIEGLSRLELNLDINGVVSTDKEEIQ